MATITSPKESSNNMEQQEQVDKFFIKDAPTIPPQTAELLEKYSGIPAGEAQVNHIWRLRDRAYQEYQYPCLGLYRFLLLALSSHPLYHTHVLPVLRGRQDADATSQPTALPIFLDLGTCLGQDIRKLIFDGAPVESVYGADILSEFIDIGYDLFQDEKKLPRNHFVVPADIFDPSSRLNEFDGKVDCLHANSVFHLFSWDDQVLVAKRVSKLMRPQKGSLILGTHIAHQEAGEIVSRPGRRTSTMWRHNNESWAKLWELVSKEVGVRFTTKSSMVEHTLTPGGEAAHQGLLRMTFEVWRD
jgi:hypothetical protein